MNDFDDDDLRVDLTPLIDVIFMLIIFFLMTMTFTLPSVELDLPQSSSAQAAARPAGELNAAMTYEGQIFCEGRPVSKGELEAKLASEHYQVLTVSLDARNDMQQMMYFADLASRYTSGRLKLNTQSAPASAHE